MRLTRLSIFGLSLLLLVNIPSLPVALPVNAAYSGFSRALMQHAAAETLKARVDAGLTGLSSGRAAGLEARAALAAGEPSRALTALRTATQAGYGNAITEFLLGQAHAQLRDTAAAVVHWRAAHAMPFYLQLGLALRHRKDWYGAERNLLTAAAIEPDRADLEDMLAQFYREWGKPAQARPHLVRAIGLNTEPYERELDQGELALLDDRPEQALQLFSAAIPMRPGRPDAYGRLAGVLAAQARPSEAIDTLKSGIAQAPAAVGLYLQLGTLLSARGMFGEADAVLAHAERIDPNTDESWLLRGQNALAAGSLAAAEEYLRTALALAPQNAESHFWLAVLRARQGDCAAARVALVDVAALAPDEPRFQTLPASEPPC